jgi:SUMO ligase MMS21 Smc5/6 complex component
MVNQVSRRNFDSRLVFAATRSKSIQRKVAFLLGCHLIMSHDIGVDEVIESFIGVSEIVQEVDETQVGLLDSWFAVHRAKSISWLNFGETFDSEAESNPVTINIEEYIHYARFS